MIPKIKRTNKKWKVMGFPYMVINKKGECIYLHSLKDAIRDWWWIIRRKR